MMKLRQHLTEDGLRQIVELELALADVLYEIQHNSRRLIRLRPVLNTGRIVFSAPLKKGGDRRYTKQQLLDAIDNSTKPNK